MTQFSKNISIFIVMILSWGMSGQTKEVTGTVTNAKDPLMGVTILIKGTAKGTTTDTQGFYKIEVTDGAVLTFHFLGMKTVEKKVLPTTSVMDVEMVENATLDEVVITALGIKKQKKSLGYAQQSIRAEKLVSSKQTDVSNALSGKIAGVQVVGAPSSGFKTSTIRLRGDVNVLYVVDGVRLKNINDVNPENIVNMSVLKGSAASALYGPEGAHGVVIINTVNSVNPGETQIIYDGAVELGNSDYFMPKLQTEYGGGYSQKFDVFHFDATKDPASWAVFEGDLMPQYYADESWGPKLDGTLVRQWYSWVPSNAKFGQKTPWKYHGGSGGFFKTAVSTKHNLTFNKTGESYNLKVNLLRNDRTLTVPNTKRVTNRFTVNLNMKATPKFSVAANISYNDRSTLNNPREGYGSLGSNFYQWWQQQLDIDNLKDYTQGGNKVSWNIRGPRNPRPKYWNSVYAELYENLKHDDYKSVFGNVDFTYAISNALKAKLSLKKTYNQLAGDSRGGFGLLQRPSYREYTAISDRNLLVGQLFFNKKLGDFSLAAIGGFEYSDYSNKFVSGATVNGLSIPDFFSVASSVDRPSYTSRRINIKNRALYITGSIGFRKDLFLEGSYRRDWNSSASVQRNAVDTKRLSLSWIASELLPKNDVLTYVKFRTSFAQAPNFPGAYATQETYSVLKAFDGHPLLNIKPQKPNPFLRGAKRTEFEVGTEFQMFKGRVSVDATYFKKIDEGLPVSVNIDPTKGVSALYQNEGKQTYQGLELGLSFIPVKNENFSWESNVNIAQLKRRVDKVSNTTTRSDYQFLSSRWGGLILRNQEGHQWGEIYGRKVKEIGGKKVINDFGTGYVTEDIEYLGNYLPSFTGGFINSFKYKNFSLAIDMDFQMGGKYFSITRMFVNSSGLGADTVGNNALGNPKRDDLTGSSGAVLVNGSGVGLSVPFEKAKSNSGGIKISGVNRNGESVSYLVNPRTWWGNQFGNMSEFTYDASYLAVRNIKLGYQLPNQLTHQLGFDQINCYAYVNNAFLLFNAIPNIDPSRLEQPYGDSAVGTVSFMEGGQLPGVRTFGFNIRLKF